MSTAKIAIPIDSAALEQVAVMEKIERLQQARLARECAKLQPQQERELAEEFFMGEASWPEY